MPRFLVTAQLLVSTGTQGTKLHHGIYQPPTQDSRLIVSENWAEPVKLPVEAILIVMLPNQVNSQATLCVFPALF